MPQAPHPKAWLFPAGVAALTATGLLAALLLDGPFARAAAWALLAVPLVLCGTVLVRCARREPPTA